MVAQNLMWTTFYCLQGWTPASLGNLWQCLVTSQWKTVCWCSEGNSRVCFSLSNISVAQNSLQYVHVSLTEECRTKCNAPGMASPVLSRGAASPPSTCWQNWHLLLQPRIPSAFSAAGPRCWLMANVVLTRSCSCFPAWWPQHMLVPGVALPQEQDFALPLLD